MRFFTNTDWVDISKVLPANAKNAIKYRIPNIDGGDIFIDEKHPDWPLDSFWTLFHGMLHATPESYNRLIMTLSADRRRQLQAATMNDSPPFGGDWYPWSVRIHNIINVNLGYPIFTGE